MPILTVHYEHSISPTSLPDIPEDLAISLFHALCAKYGWAGTIFTREDAETILDDEEEGSLSDLDWEKVKSTWEWRKGITDAMIDRAWSLVYQAVESCKITATEDQKSAMTLLTPEGRSEYAKSQITKRLI